MNRQLKQAACVWTRRPDTIGYMTGQPTSIRSTDARMVLGSNIVGRIQVRMQLIATRMTLETPTSTPVVASLIAAP